MHDRHCFDGVAAHARPPVASALQALAETPGMKEHVAATERFIVVTTSNTAVGLEKNKARADSE